MRRPVEESPEFEELVKAYASGQLIVYAGTGVSVAAGLPTFSRLVERVAEKLYDSRLTEVELHSVEELLKTDRFFEILPIARELLGEGAFTELIQRNLDDTPREIPPLARAIAELGPRLHSVLTSNLDSILERAFEGSWHTYHRPPPDIAKRSKFILKLHGSVKDPETWVLSSKDSARAMYVEPSQRSALRTLLLGRPVLFVGTSLALEQPPLKHLLELVQDDRAPRFALWASNQLTSQDQRRFGAAGIRLIGYANENGSHEGQIELLRRLSHSATAPSPVQVQLPQEQESNAGPSIEVPPFRFSTGLMRVLDVALQIRAQRKERGAELSRSALLFALVEAGRLRLQPSEPSSSRWLFERAATPPYVAALTEYLVGPFSFEPRPLNEVQRDLASVSRTPNILNLFPTAAALAKRASGTDVIATRHLLGALLADRQATRVSRSLERLMAATGSDLARLREDFLTYVKDGHPADKEEAWREGLLGRPPAQPVERLPPGYSSDDTRGEDLLELKDEISGFASVIASSALVPPLSIGLFGSWGSGKSFFMKKLRAEIDSLAARAARGGPDAQRFRSAIVPIEFNAWHYAEANLWASLVDHIFQSLSDHLLGTAKAEKQKVAQLFEQLETSKQLREEAQHKLDLAKGERTQAETTLKQLREREQQRASSLKALMSTDLWANVTLKVLDSKEKEQVKEAAQKLGLPELERSARELKAVVDTSRTVAGRTRLLASSLLLRPWPHKFLFLFALGLPALIGLGYAWAQTDSARLVTTMASSISLWLGGAVAFAKRHLDQMSSLLDALDGVDKKVSEQLAEEEVKHRDQLKAAEQALEQTKNEVSLAERRLVQADERVRAAEVLLEESRRERRIARFIQERVSSDDYRKHLGVVATVRRDFQRLSELMYPEEEDGTRALPPPPPDLPRIDRIVLYIDDLDRCPPDRVVQVLEAVHLLLAFKLFVVIVGVDSRWMLRSLIKQHPGLLVDDSAADRAEFSSAEVSAGSHDYLEKIFQIPFWLRPMDSKGASRLIAGLLAPSTETPPPELQKQDATVTPTSEVLAQPLGGDSNLLRTEDTGGGQALLPSASPVKPGEGPATKVTPTAPGTQADTGKTVQSAAQRLDLHHLESEFMENLAPYVGSSPRRVKRFVNVYRLFKASLPAKAHATFIKRGTVSGDHQPVLVLLAILTGAPRFAPTLLRLLLAEKPERRVREFVDTLKDAPDAEHRCVAGALGIYIQAQGEDVTLEALAHWAPQMGRYSFAVITPGSVAS